MFRNRVDFRGRLTLFGVLVLLSLVIMVADQAELLRPVERVTALLFTPIQNGARQLGLNLGNFGVFFTNLEQLRAENKRLQETLDAAQVDRAILAEQANQLDQLEKELNFRRNPQNNRFQTVSADVLNYDTSGQTQSVVVNKGDNDRVRPGMTVVDSSGYLVGRVSRVDADKATIVLITDKIMGVNVSNQRYDKSQKITIAVPGDGTATGQGLTFTKLIMQRIKIGFLPMVLAAIFRLISSWVM
jgi:cell shape-determining protein MreC